MSIHRLIFLLCLIPIACTLQPLPIRAANRAISQKPAMYQPPRIAQADTCAMVIAERLNLREAGSVHAPADPDGLKRNDLLRVLSRDGGWVQVETPDGRRGWINGNDKYVIKWSCE